MRIIIGGGGRVGTGLARALRSEDKDVVLVDNNARAATTPTQHTLPAIPPIYIPIPMALSPSRVVSVHP